MQIAFYFLCDLHKARHTIIVFIMKYCFANCVGVIDSGVGGLTVLKQLQRNYSTCSFVYIADSAYCPYGTRQPQQIYNRVYQMVQFLQNCGAQAVVIACNTASVYADALRSEFNIPIYDVITPTCKRVTKITASKRVALLATNATVASRVYQRYLNQNNIAVVSFPCSEFVPFVEGNKVNTADCDAVIHKALVNLPRCNVDTVILGCTHFPLLHKKIAPYCNRATIVECCTDFHAPDVCKQNNSEKTVYLTTGTEAQVNLAANWYGKVNFSHVDI